jgi:hypothetical protein
MVESEQPWLFYLFKKPDQKDVSHYSWLVEDSREKLFAGTIFTQSRQQNPDASLRASLP